MPSSCCRHNCYRVQIALLHSVLQAVIERKMSNTYEGCPEYALPDTRETQTLCPCMMVWNVFTFFLATRHQSYRSQRLWNLSVSLVTCRMICIKKNTYKAVVLVGPTSCQKSCEPTHQAATFDSFFSFMTLWSTKRSDADRSLSVVFLWYDHNYWEA